MTSKPKGQLSIQTYGKVSNNEKTCIAHPNSVHKTRLFVIIFNWHTRSRPKIWRAKNIKTSISNVTKES